MLCSSKSVELSEVGLTSTYFSDRTRCGEVIDFNSGRRDVGDDFNQNGGKPEEERSQIEEDSRQNDVEIHPDVAKWFARWHKERMNEGDDEIQQLLQQQRFVYKPYKPFRGVQLKNIHSKKGYNDLYRVCMERHCAGAESSLNVLQCAIKNACA